RREQGRLIPQRPAWRGESNQSHGFRGLFHLRSARDEMNKGARMKRLLGGLGLSLILLAAPVRADDVADFYKGKRITLIVSYGTGGGYDVYARVLARHMSRHIPGNPNIIIQNMPGAGSLRGANYLYNVASRDGTVFGTFARNMALLGLLKTN